MTEQPDSPPSLRERARFTAAPAKLELPVMPILIGLVAAVIVAVIMLGVMPLVRDGFAISPAPASATVPSFGNIKPNLTVASGQSGLTRQEKAYCEQVGRDANKVAISRVRQVRQISSLPYLAMAAEVVGSAAQLECLAKTRPEHLCSRESQRDFAIVATIAAEAYGLIWQLGTLSYDNLVELKQRGVPEFRNVEVATVKSELELAMVEADKGLERLKVVVHGAIGAGLIPKDSISYRGGLVSRIGFDRLLNGVWPVKSVCPG